MSTSYPGAPADQTLPEGGLPGTGSLTVAGPSRTEGNLPPMPSSIAQPAPDAANVETAQTTAEMMERLRAYVADNSPAGAAESI